MDVWMGEVKCSSLREVNGLTVLWKFFRQFHTHEREK